MKLSTPSEELKQSLPTVEEFEAALGDKKELKKEKNPNRETAVSLFTTSWILAIYKLVTD